MVYSRVRALLTAAIIVGITPTVVFAAANTEVTAKKTTLPGYRGVAFGESGASAHAKFKALFGPGTNEAGDVFYTGEVAGYPDTVVFPRFINNKLVHVAHGFRGQDSAIKVFLDLNNKLTATYGECTQGGWGWYKDGNPTADLADTVEYDTDQVLAFAEEGRAFLKSVWEFEGGNYLKLETEQLPNGDLWVSLNYGCPSLIQQETKQGNGRKPEL